MKKTILALIIVVIASTPCLAEVETEGLFSLDGTLWRIFAVEFTNNYFPPLHIVSDSMIGFYQGREWGWSDNCYDHGCQYGASHYADLGLISVAWYVNIGSFWNYYLAIVQPAIGFGLFTWGDMNCGLSFAGFSCNWAYGIGMMYKINDDWTSPGVE